jgi:hypothetical protein
MNLFYKLCIIGYKIRKLLTKLLYALINLNKHTRIVRFLTYHFENNFQEETFCVVIPSYLLYGCLKIREFRIQSIVGDHFSSPNMEIKTKSGLLPQRYIDLKVHSLKCDFFKYRLKSSVFIVIYGVDDCGNNNVKQFFEE